MTRILNILILGSSVAHIMNYNIMANKLKRGDGVAEKFVMYGQKSCPSLSLNYLSKFIVYVTGVGIRGGITLVRCSAAHL